jgi:integrase
MRSREYLLPAEIEKLIRAAKDGRWGHRDACLILVAYRHGLRAKEACELEWSQVEFGRSAALHVRRAKNGKPSVHPIRGDEQRMLTALRKEYPDSGYVFTTERGTPFNTGCHQQACEDHRQAGQAPTASTLPHAEAQLRLRLGQCRR